MNKPSNTSFPPDRIHACRGLVINAPELFQDPAFVDWLNNKEPKMTWHQGGRPHDFSDVVVMVDPTFTGEGTDSDMPAHCWDRVVQACGDAFHHIPAGEYHVMVRLTNLEA